MGQPTHCPDTRQTHDKAEIYFILTLKTNANTSYWLERNGLMLSANTKIVSHLALDCILF